MVETRGPPKKLNVPLPSEVIDEPVYATFDPMIEACELGERRQEIPEANSEKLRLPSWVLQDATAPKPVEAKCPHPGFDVVAVGVAKAALEDSPKRTASNQVTPRVIVPPAKKSMLARPAATWRWRVPPILFRGRAGKISD